jgi:hypothetical protein
MLRLIHAVKDPTISFDLVDQESVTLALAIKAVLVSADLLQEQDVTAAAQNSEVPSPSPHLPLLCLFSLLSSLSSSLLSPPSSLFWFGFISTDFLCYFH